MNIFLFTGRCYSKGAQTAENFLKSPDIDNIATDNNKSDVLNAYITCLNNLSACYISQKEYVKAKDVCTQIIELSPNNIKALLRAAKSSLALDLYDECELCLDTVLSIEPANDTAKKEKMRLRNVVKQYKQKEKEMAVRTIKKLADSKTNVSTTVNPQQLSAVTVTATSLNQELKQTKPNIDCDDIDTATQTIDTEKTNLKSVNSPSAANKEMPHVTVTEATQTPSKRSWSVFLLLFTSAFVLIVSVGIAWYLSNVRL